MTKRRVLPVLAVPVLAAGFALAPVVTASAATDTLTASASGAKEVSMSGEKGVGDPGASGSGTFTVDDSTGRFCYTTTATGLSDAVAMHIHKGGADVAGPVVIPLMADEIGQGKVCTTADRSLLSDIIANPSGYYWNVHTPAYSNGAARGQLTAGSPAVSAGTGGQAAQTGLPPAGIALLVLGAGAVGVAGWRLARR